MEYRMIWDFHTHTTFSHGKGSIEDNVKVAVQKGLKKIAIADHGPGHLTFGIKMEDLPKMRAEIERLKPLYPEIEILLSVEANITRKANGIDIKNEDKKIFDVIIAGYHFAAFWGYSAENFITTKLGKAVNDSVKFAGRKSLLVRNTEMVIKALHKNDIFMLTHPGDKGPFDILEIAKACAETNTLMEISNWHPYMTVEGIRLASTTDAAFALSSDAHRPERVGGFEKGLKRALEAGLDPERIVNIERI